MPGAVRVVPVSLAGGAGVGERQAGDGVDDHRRPAAGVGLQVAGLAGDLQDLGGMGEAEVVDGDRLEGEQALADALPC